MTKSRVKENTPGRHPDTKIGQTVCSSSLSVDTATRGKGANQGSVNDDGVPSKQGDNTKHHISSTSADTKINGVDDSPQTDTHINEMDDSSHANYETYVKQVMKGNYQDLETKVCNTDKALQAYEEKKSKGRKASGTRTLSSRRTNPPKAVDHVLKTILHKHATTVASALSIYSRQVNVATNSLLNNSNLSSINDGGTTTATSNVLSETAELPDLVRGVLTEYSRQEVNINSILNYRAFLFPDQEGRNTITKSFNNPIEKKDHDELCGRAQAILVRWRLCLKPGDKISCSDYHDDFENDNEGLGFIRVFDAVIKDIGNPDNAHKNKVLDETSPVFVDIGDSSTKNKPQYKLQQGELAIQVHYIGFDPAEDRWLVVNNDPNMTIVPRKSHSASQNALKREEEIPDKDDEREAGEDDRTRTNSKTEKILNGKKEQKNEDVETDTHMRSSGLKTSEKGHEKNPKSPSDNEDEKVMVTSKAMNDPSVASKQSKNRKQSKRKAKPDSGTNLATKVPIEDTVTSECFNVDASTSKKCRSSAVKKATTKSAKNATGQISGSPKGKAKRKRSKPKDDHDLSFTWICTECREAECIMDEESPLLLCEGRCNRPFHYPCAGLSKVPPQDETWICRDCTQGRHQCAICHHYGLDDEEVYCCDSKSCGLFFHEACLQMYNVEVEIVETVVPKQYNASKRLLLASLTTEPFHEGEEKKEHLTEDVKMIDEMISIPRFQCPAHNCWTCTDEVVAPVDEHDDETGDVNASKKTKKRQGKKRPNAVSNCFSSKNEMLFRCLECPNAYHLTCIHPLAQFHELAMLCHEHALTSKLPALPMESSYQAKVEADADKKLERVRKSKEKGNARTKKQKIEKVKTSTDACNPFFRGMKGDSITVTQKELYKALQSDQDVSSPIMPKKISYCLPSDFQAQVYSKPPVYKQVHSLRYSAEHRPKRRPPSGEVCLCQPKEDGTICGYDCLNRMLMIECIGDSTKSSGEKNPYWNCNHGSKCENRGVSQRQFAKCRPMREQGKGWGLVSVSGIKKVGLVQEYAGEVIDSDAMKARLHSWSIDHPNDPNFYVMRLEPGWYIDAREQGNLARFINHSCGPNCHLVPVNVSGYMRVAIFALRDIAPGEFLSYDYQFDTKHGEKFVCRCGAENCRGTMKGGKGSPTKGGDADEALGVKSKKDVWLEAKARYDRDLKFLTDIQEGGKQRLNLISARVPGDKTVEADTVASGPQDRDKKFAQGYRIFLWRNAVAGSDFSSRHWRYVDSMKKGRKSQKALEGDTEDRVVDVIQTIKK
eukprot:scaffold29883_cov48-Attheya_sp.AAC.4